MKYLLIAICILCILIWADTVWSKDKHIDLVREFYNRLDWNNPPQKDFILRVEIVVDNTTFCPQFIVHPMDREEETPKNLDMIVIDKDGLKEVIR